MRRACIATAAAAALGAALAAQPAAAEVVELGVTPTRILAPVCPPGVTPAKCTIILTQVTAFETVRDAIAYPTRVKKPGRIVAFTIGLSRLSSDRNTAKTYIHNLDVSYGGTAQAAITVLRRVGPASRLRFKVVAESEIEHLQPYLGQVVQFPLFTSLAVKRGDVVALTTPTWAPVLSILQPNKQAAYRQSRTSNCSNPPITSQAQSVGESARYLCNYQGTRAEYSATEVTNPVALHPIHAGDTFR
jgi:hypothetical protein